MKKQPFCNFSLAGVSLTEFGLVIPAPFTQLQVYNSQIDFKIVKSILDGISVIYNIRVIRMYTATDDRGRINL